MNKKKWIIGIGSLFVLMIIVIIVVAVKSKKETDVENPNIYYFDKGRSIDDIEWISVAEDGVSTCLVAYDFAPYYYYDVVPGRYIIYTSIKGNAEFINVYLDDNFVYDEFKIYAYDIATRKTRLVFDVTELIDENPNIQVTDEAKGCFVIGEEFIYQNVYEQRPNKDIPYGQEIDKDYLCINIEDSSYRIQKEIIGEWYTDTITVFYVLEEEKLLSNNLPAGMLEEMGPEFAYYAISYQNFEGVFEVRGLAEYLPEHNEVLYGMFPGLEQYRGEEDCHICLYIAGNPTAEELLRLFMEDGQEISFEGVVLSGKDSIDGEDHEIRSFEEYEQWYDAERE